MLNTLTNITQIEKVNDVSFVIWCYWSGKSMSKNRSLSFNTLVENIGVPVFLVNSENIKQIEKATHPFHKAFPYLSDVHKSDYVRIYLLHHYGGAWHDIKATEVSFKDAWSEFTDPTIYMIGRPERLGGPAKVFDDENRWMPDYWQDLISVTSWIGRPNSDLSQAMLNDVEELLDQNLNDLKKYPAKHSREKKKTGKNLFSKLAISAKNLLTGRNNNYPLPWTVFGNVFHPLNYKFKNHISLNLPKDKIKNAGIYHR